MYIEYSIVIPTEIKPETRTRECIKCKFYNTSMLHCGSPQCSCYPVQLICADAQNWNKSLARRHQRHMMSYRLIDLHYHILLAFASVT